ncbi:MAG TPA: MFS transporter [Beijerinckiaceae bacterium]|jgi:hypothetical protein
MKPESGPDRAAPSPLLDRPATASGHRGGATSLGRDFILLATGVGSAQVGGWTRRMILGWQVWELTGSPFWVGMVGFFDLAPTILLSPIAGPVIDRSGPVRVLRATQAANLAQGVLLLVGAWLNLLNLAALLAFTAGFAVVYAFDGPATNAALRRIVGIEALARAISINSILNNGALFVAPLVAAFLIRVGGAAGGYAAAAAGGAVFLGLLLVMKAPADAGLSRASQGTFLEALGSGYAYAAADRRLRSLLISFSVVSVGARSLTYLMPALAAGLLAGDPDALAVLLSMLAGGALLAGVLVGLQGAAVNVGRLLVASLAGAAGCLAAIFAAPSLWLAAVAAFGLGMSLACNSISTQTAIQTVADQEMNGRVISLYGMIFRGGPALGSLAAGSLAASLGLPPVGVAFATAIAWNAWSMRSWWKTSLATSA